MPLDPDLEHAKALARGANASQAEAVRRAAEGAASRARISGQSIDPDLERAKAIAQGATQTEADKVYRASIGAASREARSNSESGLQVANRQSLSTGNSSTNIVAFWFVATFALSTWIHSSLLGRDINDCLDRFEQSDDRADIYCRSRDLSIEVFLSTGVGGPLLVWGAFATLKRRRLRK